jgi:prevent-host-death family protein
MVEKIGVRELKNQASQIVKNVHEEMAEYVITVRGIPVAVLRPISEVDEQAWRQSELDTFIAQMDSLAQQAADEWESDKTAVQLLEEQRRG